MTGDKRWDKDGDLYMQYDLEFDEDYTETVVVNEGDQLPQETEPLSDPFGLPKCQDFGKACEGVKVLSEKYEDENKKIDAKVEINDNESTDDLFNEFQDILLSEKNVGRSQKRNDQNRRDLPSGILNI